MTYAVETCHLSKSIDGNAILNDITMGVKQGEIYGFLGANGAGKTSLMKTLYHIMAPDAGAAHSARSQSWPAAYFQEEKQ